MRLNRIPATAAAALCLAIGACNSQPQNKAPELRTATPVQPINQPTTVTGCLRAGAAENTFVLNTGAEEGAPVITYQLTGKNGDELRGFAGQEVQVSGTVRDQQSIATSGSIQEKPAKDAAGTPQVQTTAELNIRSLDVASVKPTGKSCPAR
jgi:hypothetical protein